MPPDDSLDAQLRALPARPIDPRVDDRALRKARAVLLQEPRHGVLHALQTFWERAVAPVLVTGTVAGYLVWAVQSAGSLYR
jgi:hypothetical protein